MDMSCTYIKLVVCVARAQILRRRGICIRHWEIKGVDIWRKQKSIGKRGERERGRGAERSRESRVM